VTDLALTFAPPAFSARSRSKIQRAKPKPALKFFFHLYRTLAAFVLDGSRREAPASEIRSPPR
jgi:hypothetical protein